MYKEEFKFKAADGNIYTFKTKPNPLNSNQMWWIEPQPNVFEGSVKQARRVANNIKENNKVVLSYEDWIWKNEDLLAIELAESGADRELDFDYDTEALTRYEKYLRG